MKIKEIIENLESQALDRESLMDIDDPTCQFREDRDCLNEAIAILEKIGQTTKYKGIIK
jgi:hypothetical protein